MSKFNLDKALKKFEAVKQSLPKVLANDSVRFFNKSFQRQGWEDTTLQAWQKRVYNKTKRDETRKILVKSGALRRAVATSVKQISFDKIKFVVDLPYAAVHNEGLEARGGYKMPRRKFMGDSKALRKIQKEKIVKAIDSIWRGY